MNPEVDNDDAATTYSAPGGTVVEDAALQAFYAAVQNAGGDVDGTDNMSVMESLMNPSVPGTPAWSTVDGVGGGGDAASMYGGSAAAPPGYPQSVAESFIAPSAPPSAPPSESGTAAMGSSYGQQLAAYTAPVEPAPAFMQPVLNYPESAYSQSMYSYQSGYQGDPTLDSYLRSQDPALMDQPQRMRSPGGSTYSTVAGAPKAPSPRVRRAVSPRSVAGSYAGSNAGSMPANSMYGGSVMTGFETTTGSGYEISEDEQKLLAAIQVLEAAMQAVEKGNGSGAAAGISGSYVPPVPQTPSYESKPIKLRKPVSALEQNSWTRSLAKAAVSVGLAPDSWIVRDARDEMDEPVQLNTDPRLAEDFAAECKVFYSKANDGRAQRAAMLADGVGLAVCKGMAKNLPFAVAQEWGCRTLEILAISSDHTHKVAATGGIKAVVAAMSAHVSNEAVQEAGCAALRNLTVNSDAQAKAAACGAIEAVVAAMTAHGSHVGVQEAGCQMLRNLSSRANKDKVVSAGGIESVVSAMNAHVGDAGVQEAACVVLRKLCVTPEHQSQAVAAGAIEAVLQALQVHGYSSSLGSRRPLMGDDESALARGGLAASRPTRRPQKNAPGSAGPGDRPQRARPTRMVAPAPTLRLPSRWPLQPVTRDNNKQKNTMHSSDMQLQGCAALRLLITSEESKLKAMSAGATDVLLAALRGNRNNSEVQEQACAVLAVLTLDSLTEILAAGNFSDALLVCKAMLRTQADNLPVVEKAIAVLVGLIQSSDAQVRAAGEAGVIEALMKPLMVHTTNADIQEQGMLLLRSLSSNVDNVPKIMSAGGVEVIMAAMDEHLQNAVIQEAGCATLCNFTEATNPQPEPKGKEGLKAAPRPQADEKAVAKANHGGIRVVVAALQAHADDVAVLTTSCRAIRALCVRTDNQVKAAVAGGIEALVSTLRIHVDNPTIMELASGAMAAITGIAINKAKADETGVIEAVIAALAQHPMDAAVQEQGCRALASITVTRESQARAAASGGIELVVQALHTHVETETMAEAGCGALKNLTANPENHIIAADKGAIKAVIEALAHHTHSAGVQEGGCGVLKNLTVHDDKKVEAAQEGGIEVVLNALRVHSSHVGVAEAGCGALGLLVANPDNERRVASVGGIEAVVQALRAHFSHPKVAEAGCGALGNLAVTTKHQIIVASVGGIDATVAAMRVHVDQPEVQLQGCAALRNLAASNTENQKQIARAWGIEAVVTAMTAHPNHVELQVVGCAALRNFASIGENEVAVAAAGGIEAIVQALRIHGNSAALQESGCEALASIVWSQLEIQRWALQAGAREVCKAAITTRFPKHEGVQRTARLALAKVSAARNLRLLGIPAAGTLAATRKDRQCVPSTPEAENLVAWLGNDMPNSDWLDLVQLAMQSDLAELKDSLLRLPQPTYVYSVPQQQITNG